MAGREPRSHTPWRAAIESIHLFAEAINRPTYQWRNRATEQNNACCHAGRVGRRNFTARPLAERSVRLSPHSAPIR
jgi:hypothetical protein